MRSSSRSTSSACPSICSSRERAESYAALNRLELLRSPGITLRDRRNGDDPVSRARRSPSTVKHDGEERSLIAAAEKRAVQALWAWDAAGELAVRREDIH